jgi:hemerythrin-like domain-containing protein
MTSNRRSFVLASAGLVVLGACKRDGKEEADVEATEDLMREHGVLRRALVVYRECATRLRADAGSIPPEALARTAKLFRTFGEDYHERAVEEPFVLPAIDQTLAGAIKAQHERGRALQDWILGVAVAPKISARAQDLARVLDALARMYETHAAREDTIVFPAWKKTMTKKQLDEMSDRFEEIEKKELGPNGFEHAAREMDEIEASLGLSDLRSFDAPPPPQA